jgi:hypothetical protein
LTNSDLPGDYGRLEGHSVIFLAIQTHLSCRFHLAVDFPNPRRSGSWSQIINQAQDFREQFPRRRYLGQLEGDVAAMSDTPLAHEMTIGRVFYQKISPIKGQIVIYRAGLGRTRAGTPFVLPSLATRASHLGNPG